jgi:hypothetical protein
VTLHTSTRVPVHDAYATLVGKAVYVFAYYEWGIIWAMEFLEPGFVQRYSRQQVMTSGTVARELQRIIASPATSFAKVSRADLEALCDEFLLLIEKRNALIHAHPMMDTDGAQILGYQTKVTKPLPDMKWPKAEVEAIIATFDAAACGAGVILDRLRR